MKKGNLKNWKVDRSEEAELFYAQRMNELLFDYTLDSFKYYALNINQLLIEARQRIDKVKNELTADENFKDIIAELNSKGKSDLLTKAILGHQYSLYFPLKVHNQKAELSLNIEILINKLSLSALIKKSFKLIEENIDTGSKINLNILSNQLVTALVNVGFHQSYIYHQLNFHFFGGKLAKNRTVSKFFKYFQSEKKEFEVYIIVSDSFREIKELCTRFNLEIIDELNIDGANTKVKGYIDSIEADQVFAKCKKIKAYDSQSARLSAISLLNSLAGYFTFFHHKNPPKIIRSAIVNSDAKTFLIEPTASPMAKGEDMNHRDAGKMLEEFLKRFTPTRKTSLKINRVVNLHSHAISTSSNENRLLNLWISYETLFGTGKTTTVVHIINSLCHIASLTYFERIFNELSKSIENWDRKEMESIKKLTGLDSNTEAACSFICSSDFDTERNNLYSKLNEFPLLRFRIDDLNKNLNTASHILRYLEKHNKRIRWHIKRLYRTRNRIVHDGYRAKNLEILVENAHSYFDIFMDEFIIDNMTSGSVSTVEQAVKHYQTLDNMWIKNLRANESVVIDKSNFSKYLMYKRYCR